jgi:hypothetical protein
MMQYIKFFTDFGLKWLFGSEPTKACLIDFLNQLLAGEEEPCLPPYRTARRRRVGPGKCPGIHTVLNHILPQAPGDASSSASV